MSNKIDYSKFDLELYASKFAQIDPDKSKNGDAWFNCCFHEERTASLHVSGKSVFYCQGCNTSGGIRDFVKKANNLTNEAEVSKIIREFSGEESVALVIEKNTTKFYEPVYEAKYEWNNGHVVKYRLPNKEFRWANYNGEDWYNGIGYHDIGLYMPSGVAETIIIAEGEKDADAVCELGFIGVSVPNGGHTWNVEYIDDLEGVENVLILADKDYNGTGEMQASALKTHLIRAGFKVQLVMADEFTPATKEGFDFYDVVESIGPEKATELMNVFLQGEFTDVTWNEDTGEIIEVVEAEVIEDSGMGEDFDNLIEKAVNESNDMGMISPATTLELRDYAKSSGLGITYINKYIKSEIDSQKVAYVSEIENNVMEVAELGMNVDIKGSGYVVDSDSSIYDEESGNVVLGHFLAFGGIVIDAEAEQDNDVKVLLLYNTPQNLSTIKTMVVPKRQLSSSTDIINLLSGYNINVTQVNGLNVVKYLQDSQDHFKEDTRIMRGLSRFGWFEDNLMPYEQQKSQIVYGETVSQSIIDKLVMKQGSREKSLELMKMVAQYSEVNAVILGAAVGSLLLSYMNDGGNQSFALNVWNETSTGKSVTCQAVASLFGYPYKDGGWWGDGNATMNSDINHNSMLGNLPNFIDDPARNRGYDSNAKRDYVFAATSGQGRGRMKRDGMTAQKQRTWCNIMIMTNETMFIDESIEDGGARARCLEVSFDKPLDRDTVLEWIDIMGSNYGHFAVEIADRIKHLGKFVLDGELKSYTRWFNNNGVDGKRAVNAAYIVVGLNIIDEMLKLDAKNPDEWLVKQIRGSGELSDGARAYAKLIRRIEVSEKIYQQMYDRNEVFVGSFGYSEDKRKVVNLPAKTVQQYAKEEGFNANSLITWSYMNGKMVSQYDNNDKPRQVLIANKETSLEVVQVYYDWNCRQVHQDLDDMVFQPVVKVEEV